MAEDDFNNDPYFANDVFFKDYTIGGVQRDQGIIHIDRCAMKTRDPKKEAISRIFGNNPSANAYNAMVTRRPSDQLCYCDGWKYDISIKTWIKCFGCGRSIRTSGHTCRTYDLFNKNEWLSKKKSGKLHRKIRCRNFESLAKHLPFVLPDCVLNHAMDITNSCQGVVFHNFS